MATYKSAYSGPQIDEAIGRVLSGSTDGSSNLNLLDNCGFTINQRGLSSYTGNAYTVDRWRFQNNAGTCNVVTGGITFTNSASGYGYFTQILDFTIDSAKTYTLSIIADGQLYSTRNGGSGITLPSGLYLYFANSTQITIRVPGNLNSSEVISAVKLELGSVSTLANDVAPNYAEELAKCQYYFYRFNGLVSAYTVPGSTVSAITIPFPVTMRGVPAVSNVTYYDSKVATGQGAYVSGVRFYNSSNVGFSVTGFDASCDL